MIANRMIRIGLAAGLALVPAILAPSTGGDGLEAIGERQAAAASEPDAAERVRTAEISRQRALVDADYAALDALLDDDLVYTHSNARVDTKASYFEPLRSGRTRYQSFDASDLEVRMHGTTAIVTGTARTVALVAGQQSRTMMRFTNVWIERDGRWRMVAWQSTRLP